MIIGFVLVLSIIGILLALAMYANLLPFIGLIGDVKQYNIAYYGAESSLERALLVLRNQEPGFEGKSGYSGAIFLGPKSDQNTNLGLFMTNNNRLSWEIIGRGPLIPLTGAGNISQSLLNQNESNDYNSITYGMLDRIIMRYDSTIAQDAYVKDNSYVFLSGSTISIQLKTNTKISSTFGEILNSSGDVDGDGVKDDIVLDRSWKGKYDDNGTTGDFSILPRYKIFYPNIGDPEMGSGDESVRESIINDQNGIRFGNLGTNEFNPITPLALGSTRINTDNDSHLIITDNDILSGESFYSLLHGSLIGGLSVYLQEIGINLVNPLITENGSIYPSIEYKVNCHNCGNQNGQSQLAQPYFNINAGATIGSYDIRMNMKKSTSDDSTVSSFTVIF